MHHSLRLISAFSLLVAACGGGDGNPGSCDLDFSGAVNANFGDAELDALLEASGSFAASAAEMDAAARDACNSIASDLGGATSDDTATACDNAVAEIDAVLAANSGVSLVVEVTPAVCAVDIDAVLACTAECDASFDASATPPTCEGGELSGSCSGQCEGSCTVSGDVACDASCEGTCSGSCTGSVQGSCTGVCNGVCEGTCSATDGDGNCAGTCTGTCRGSCEGTIEGSCNGTCSGSCSGSCRADVDGSCEGSCSGSCDVAFEEPRCEGGHLEVEADAECQAACESRASFEVECSDPQVVVAFTGAAADVAAMLSLLATLEANYGKLLGAAAQAEIVIDATAQLGGSLQGAVSAAASLGLEAASCLTAATAAAVDAAASVMLTVEVSVEVSGSVSAGS